MTHVNPYFNFNGNTEEAMNFYKSILGGEFTSLTRFKDIPGGDQMPDSDKDLLMHICLTTPNGLQFMATDVVESMGQRVVFGNNNYICVHTESEAETEKLFNGLSVNGKIEMPLNQTFWGAYCGMFQDQYGVQWLLNFEEKNKPAFSNIN